MDIIPSNGGTVTANAKPKVLAIIHPDGFLQFYCDQPIDLRVVDFPLVSSPKAEILAETYLELTLPQYFRGVYWPGNLKHVHTQTIRNPADLADAQWRQDFLSTLQSLSREAST